jgi:DNA helicase HerA-like ATPase
LINITARGRSLGLILFGAEQFASAVDREIVENSSTFLFGRTETNELRTPTYSALSEEVKSKLTMLEQGHLLAKFPKFSQPIFLRFPLPPCLPGDQYQEAET